MIVDWAPLRVFSPLMWVEQDNEKHPISLPLRVTILRSNRVQLHSGHKLVESDLEPADSRLIINDYDMISQTEALP
jgi:hypothetical protein